MPSYAANQIKARLEAALDRKLDKDETGHVEEMVMNVYPEAVLELIAREVRHKRLVDFAVIYYPVMNGNIPGAKKLRNTKRLTGNLGAVYRRFDALLPDGYSQRELDHIILLAEDCTQSEIEWGIKESVGRNVRSAIYSYRAIINHRKEMHSPKVKLKGIDSVDVVCKIHDVDHSVDAWRQKLLSRKVTKANEKSK